MTAVALEPAGEALQAAVVARDLDAMLRGCAAVGYRPVLYAELSRAGDPEWVCYPENEVRAFKAFRGPDPLGVVRQLAQWAVQHPNAAPTFFDRVMGAFDQRRGPCAPTRCADYAWGRSCPCVLRGYLAVNPTPGPPPAPTVKDVTHG